LRDKNKNGKGTTVGMSINTKSNRNIAEVFDDYTSDIDLDGVAAFTKTIIAVYLLRYGNENLVSRSQATRLLRRLENFKEVVLNFENVDMIGKAFADEIFRVYQNNNPNIKISWINAEKNVEGMILRTRNIQTGPFSIETIKKAMKK
jgi:hypothetical protein